MSSTGGNTDEKSLKDKLMKIMLISGISVLVGGLIFAGLRTFHLDKLVEALELKTYDLRASLGIFNQSHRPSSDVVIVTFDDPTLQIFEDEYGTWPWPRSVHADMIHFLNDKAKPKSLAYDIMFVSNKKGMQEDDQQLIDAFQNHDNVYVSMNFNQNRKEMELLGKGLKKADLARIDLQSLNLSSHLGPKSAGMNLSQDPAFGGQYFYNNPAMSFNIFRPLVPGLMDVPGRVAFVNHGRDSDGVSRGNPLFFRFHYPYKEKSPHPPYKQDEDTGKWYDAHENRVTKDGILLDKNGKPVEKVYKGYFPYLGFRLFLDMKFPNQTKPPMILTNKGTIQVGDYEIPLSSNGNFLVNWYNVNVDMEQTKTNIRILEDAKAKLDIELSQTINPERMRDLKTDLSEVEHYLSLFHKSLEQRFVPKPYQEIPAWRILKAMRNMEKNYSNVKADDRAQQRKEDQDLITTLKDKVVFIGITAVALYDIKTTPISERMPGVVLQANIFDNLYQGQSFMQRASEMSNTLMTAMLCLITMATILKLRSAVAGLLTTFCLVLIYIIYTIWAYHFIHLWVNVANPLFSVFITTTLTFMVKYISRDQDYEETYRMATTDSMTGLRNHRYFQEQMLKHIEHAEKVGGKFSLILVDIDHFKKFNDTYGHQAGDEVLRQVAQKLKNSVRGNDMVARYGGEEMAVILDRTAEEEAMAVGWKLVKRVAEEAYPIADGVAKHVTISVGVSTYPNHGESPSQLIEFSDQGLYRAKENGRNQVGKQHDDDAELVRPEDDATTEDAGEPPQEASA
ncbi:MAG: diguanylate cyclase [Vampirovibrio sp.]|nr:diguanylate cyclase [Vampirovibrio sp.]